MMRKIMTLFLLAVCMHGVSANERGGVLPSFERERQYRQARFHKEKPYRFGRFECSEFSLTDREKRLYPILLRIGGKITKKTVR